VRGLKMSGLSQLQLDALCCTEESVSEPSSPIGSMLLARKRLRHRRAQSQEMVFEDMRSTRIADQEGSGLSQADLDSLAVEEESTKDMYAGSPLGTSLCTVKSRRRLGGVEERLLPAVAEQEQASFTPSPCPASWGGSVAGISQAELDAMCDDHAIAEDSETHEVPKSPLSASQSGRRRRGRASCDKSSPLRPSRMQKVDAENMGGKEATLSVSPAKTMESVSPGSKSPQRRHFASPLGRSPLSPALLN
jgi:hypothetical protein